MRDQLKHLRAMIQYGDYYEQATGTLKKLLVHYQKEEKTVAIWGAGLKGTSFLSVIDPKAQLIRFVIDKNEELNEQTMRTGHKIVSDKILRQEKIDVVLIINEKYYVSILTNLRKLNFQGSILNIDKIVQGKESDLGTILSEGFAEKVEDDCVSGVTLSQVQEVVFEILEEVDRVCRENNIPYVLEAGSALGAEKCKGFLTCDNDADIAMLRVDFERFRKIAPSSLQQSFLLQSMDKHSDYPYPYAQVVKDETCYVRYQLEAIQMHHGIHIDIAPLDTVPKEIAKRGKQIKQVRKWTKGIYKRTVSEVYYGHNPFKKCVMNYEHYLYRLLPKTILRYFLNRAFTRYSKVDTGIVGDLCTHYEKDLSFPREWLFPPIYRKFEGKAFPVPSHIQEYLEVMYDEYKEMTPSQSGYTKYALAEVSLDHNYKKGHK